MGHDCAGIFFAVVFKEPKYAFGFIAGVAEVFVYLIDGTEKLNGFLLGGMG